MKLLNEMDIASVFCKLSGIVIDYDSKNKLGDLLKDMYMRGYKDGIMDLSAVNRAPTEDMHRKERSRIEGWTL